MPVTSNAYAVGRRGRCPVRGTPSREIREGHCIGGQFDELSVGLISSALDNLLISSTQRDALLARASVTPQLLQDSNGCITLRQFASIWRGVMRETGDELFNLDKRGMARGSFHLMCLSALQSGTLEVAISRFLRFWSILLDDFLWELSIERDDAHIFISERGPARSGLAYSIILASLLGACSWLIDRRIIPRDAKLRSHADDSSGLCRAVISPKASFDHAMTQLTIDARLLSIKPIRNEQQLSLFLASCPEAVLVPYVSRDTISAKIQAMLRQLAPDAWPSFDMIAQDLGTTSSTLRRRLADECANFQQIKDDIRRERAIEHLTRDRLSIVGIAEDLGFGDTSTFYRAFKKWTGTTPSVYRMSRMPRD